MSRNIAIKSELDDAPCAGDMETPQPPFADDPPRAFGFGSFFTKAMVWCAITFFVATQFASSHFWLVVLSVFLFSVPIALCGIYTHTIHQIRRLYIFAKRGWIFRLVSGRPLKALLWICWSLVSSFFMLVQFHTYTRLEWCIFFLVIPVFWFVFKVLRKSIRHELRPFVVTSVALAWSRRICPLVMLLTYLTAINEARAEFKSKLRG